MATSKEYLEFILDQLSMLDGIPVENVANPEALKHPRWQR